MCSSEKIKSLVINETEYRNQQVLHTLIIKIHVTSINYRISGKSSVYSDKSLMILERPF